MKALILLLLLFPAFSTSAQITKVTLQASGLTCSMCSRAVKNALEEVPVVEKVQVDIKNQQYNINFKEGAQADLDALAKAVEDAGFSIARLTVTATVDNLKPAKDEHIRIGNQYFHFLNANGKELDKTVNFNIVDKGFVPAKEFKKYSNLSKMRCVQTGVTAACCSADGSVPEGTRVFHVIL